MEAAVLLLPALFKEDLGLLFEVEVSNEQLTTVCETHTSFTFCYAIKLFQMQALVFCLMVYTNYAIKVKRKLYSFTLNGKSI